MEFIVVVLTVIAAVFGWVMDPTLISMAWWAVGTLLVLTIILTLSENLLGIVTGVGCAFAFITALAGTVKSAFMPAIATTVAVTATGAGVEGSTIWILVTSVSEAPYAYSGLLPLFIFLTFCLSAWLYDSDWTGTGFFTIAIVSIMLFVGALSQGSIIELGVTTFAALVLYVVLGWLYAIHWYSGEIDKRYQPYFDRLEKFLDDNGISLPVGISLKEFDVLDPKHLDPKLITTWQTALEDDHDALRASQAMANQTVANEADGVIAKMVGWPGVAFGDLLSNVWRVISSAFSGFFSGLAKVITYPFRMRTAEQTKAVRTPEEIAAAAAAARESSTS